MKKLIVLCLLFFFSCKEKEVEFIKAKLIPSEIDSLKNEEQVKNFMVKVDSNYINLKPTQFQEMYFGENTKEDSVCKTIAKLNGVNKTSYKADFDNNGYNDLLVITQKCTTFNNNTRCDIYTPIYMNLGNKSYNVTNPSLGYHSYVVPKIKYKKKTTFIRSLYTC